MLDYILDKNVIDEFYHCESRSVFEFFIPQIDVGLTEAGKPPQHDYIYTLKGIKSSKFGIRYLMKPSFHGEGNFGLEIETRLYYKSQNLQNAVEKRTKQIESDIRDKEIKIAKTESNGNLTPENISTQVNILENEIVDLKDKLTTINAEVSSFQLLDEITPKRKISDVYACKTYDQIFQIYEIVRYKGLYSLIQDVITKTKSKKKLQKRASYAMQINELREKINADSSLPKIIWHYLWQMPSIKFSVAVNK